MTPPVMRPLDGRISNRLYWGPKGAPPLEVFRNYQHALTAAGFETLFACEAQQCLTLKVQPMLSELPRTADWIRGVTRVLEARATDGKIALYGVLFDTNKAVLREESASQLAETARVFEADPALKAFIVGHTDNEGGFDANMGLSPKRAAAAAPPLCNAMIYVKGTP